VLKAHAFILYFDTFFSPSGAAVPEGTAVHLVKEGQAALAEVWQIPGKTKRKDSAGEKGKEVSFSTGPLSSPTHWKHALFLLREPIKVEEGKMGRFRPSAAFEIILFEPRNDCFRHVLLPEKWR
jgi:type I protein arginine methyltransferase